MNSLKSKFLVSCIGTAVGEQLGAGDIRHIDETVIILWQIKKARSENEGNDT